jgi:hypothetical protein
MKVVEIGSYTAGDTLLASVVEICLTYSKY